MFRYSTNGRGSVPSVISKEHLPTSAAYSQPPVEAIILTCAKTYYLQSSQKNAKTSLLVYWMGLRARTACGIGFRLLWRPLPLVAPVLVCSDSPRMEAGRADS